MGPSSQGSSPNTLISNNIENGPEDLDPDPADRALLKYGTQPDTLEEFYFTQWTTSVTPILPPVFADLTVSMPDFLPFRYAVLAVSASHMAHVESSILSGESSTYIPERTHRYRSLQYYGRGIRELAKYVDGFPTDTLCYLVATSLLFHYIEMDSGSIAGSVEHIESINRLHCSARSQIELGTTELDKKLLCTWQSLRSLSINKQLTVGSGRIRPLVGIQLQDLASPVGDGATSYDFIAQLLCETFSTSRTIILDWCVCRGTSLATADEKQAAFGALIEHIALPGERNRTPLQLANIDESYCRTIEQQRARLDDWHSQLNISDLPIESFTSTSMEPIRDTEGELHVEPLRFHTYEAAMNYAYYAAAQLSSSRETFDRITQLEGFELCPTFTRDSFPWESLILRITRGLDLNDCLYKHTFKIGILSLLMLCASLCPHIAVANWANAWIEKLEDHGMAVEDGMPLALIKRIMRLITMMKQQGHDMYRISIVDSDIKEKWEFYRSDSTFQVAICARDRSKRELYNNVVSLPI
ncbi:hypothetical protein N7510_003326 [Penicillium lagena]|uniref:uncharacterized protein n=1 Tax=Penicillium lagena TaxID=94218 RepID=UPI00253F93B6|nr:uncharacterized protein N7510_003326 [Penicillium lagena]KAJ5619342.1 hypothetical protein N7510_003326 [Penicillium lagena]